MVKRRKFLIGAGALFSGSAAAMGTGAFSQMDASRTMKIDNNAGDNKGAIKIAPVGYDSADTDNEPRNIDDPSGNSEYASMDEDGGVVLNLDGWADNKGYGWNKNATFYLDNVLFVGVRKNNDSPGSYDGSWSTNSPYEIQLTSTASGVFPYLGSGRDPSADGDAATESVTLNAGESQLFGFQLNPSNFDNGSSDSSESIEITVTNV